MDKIWRDADPPGIPAEIDPGWSLADLLDASFAQHAANPAFVCMDRFLTYGELDEMSRRLAAWLQSRGMAPGARVAIMLPNVLQHPVALGGVLRAGFAAVGIDPQLGAEELGRQLRDAGCEAIIVLENFAHVLESALPHTPIRHVVVASSGELLGGHGIMVDFVVRHVKRQVPDFTIPQMVRFRAALAQGARMPFASVPAQPSDIACLAFADGALEAPVALTHADAIAAVRQLDAWAQPALAPAPVVAFPTIVSALPLHGVAGLVACALWGMRGGSLHLLVPNPRDVKDMIQELARYPFHIFPGTGALYDALVHDPDFQHLDFSTLKLCNASAPVEQAVAGRWQAVTGVPIVQQPVQQPTQQPAHQPEGADRPISRPAALGET